MAGLGFMIAFLLWIIVIIFRGFRDFSEEFGYWWGFVALFVAVLLIYVWLNWF